MKRIPCLAFLLVTLACPGSKPSSTSGSTSSTDVSGATSGVTSSSTSGATTGHPSSTTATFTSGTTATTSAASSTSGTTGTGSSSGGSSGGGTPIGGDSVLMHHKNPNRDGLYVNSTLTKAAIGTLHADPSFATTNIVGNVYAQPLFVDGQGGTDLVIIATESDSVYALNATTGAQVWMTNVGTSVPLAMLPCGNIDPVGITGTPVIDPATRTLFLDAELLVSGAPTHRVFALSVDDGSIRTGWPVDIPMTAASGTTVFQPAAQGERGALAVLGGSVYVPFGGRYGDCAPYYGWVVGISISNPASVQAWSTTANGGGAWMPSGIASDGTSLFVSTGNTFTSGAGAPWSGGDAFVSLAPGAALSLQAYFAPKNWFDLDEGDLDMGAGPVLLDLPGSTPSALAILFGKDGNAYLVDRNNPGGVGSALGANAAGCTATNTTNACSSLPVASDEIISASTVYSTAMATYVVVRGNGKLCTGGTSGDLLALTVSPGSPPTLAGSWCGTAGSGSPMVTTSNGHADAMVWTLGADNDSLLHAFDGDTGAPIKFTDSKKLFPGMRRFNTPIEAKGRIYVPVDGTNGGVVAFTL